MRTDTNDSWLARALARTEPEDDTARRILDAALEQFTLLGVRRSSVDDVAKRAGVSRVTVYRRFQTKDRLVEETLLRELSRFFARLDAAVAGLPTMRERVIEGFVVALRHTRAHPLFGGMLRLEPEVVLPYLTVQGGSSLTQQLANMCTPNMVENQWGSTAIIQSNAMTQNVKAKNTRKRTGATSST